MTTAATELKQGDAIGPYSIEGPIGRGRMGRVYRAHEVGIERDVAIKILHRELLRNPMLVARFQREARAAARLAHPNVIGVHRPLLLIGFLTRRHDSSCGHDGGGKQERGEQDCEERSHNR